MPDILEQQKQYVNDPVLWAHDICGFDPEDWQREELRATVDNRFVAWSTGHGVGKSCALALRALHFLVTRPFSQIPCTAPTQHQLFDILWKELAKWIRRSEFLSGILKWTQTKVSVKGHEEEWFIVARTSRPNAVEQSAEGLQGFHAEHLMFIIDEASGVPDQIMSAVDGALTTSGAQVIMASNPTRKSGYFYNAVFGNKDSLWKTRIVSCKDVPEHRVSSQYVDHMRTTYGEDSDMFRVKVLGLPPHSDSSALVTPEQIFAAHKRILPHEGPIVLSCDPARFGDDDSVFYVRHGRMFIFRKTFHGMDIAQLTKIGMDLVEYYDPDQYNIDSIGIGAGLVDHTKKEMGVRRGRIRGIGVGEKAKNPDKFYNLRAELYWAIRTYIDSIGIALKTELLDQELTSIRYGWDTKDTRIKIQSKDIIKKELGRSPNDADAFILNLAGELLPNVSASVKYFDMGARSTAQVPTNLITENAVQSGRAAIVFSIGDGGRDSLVGGRRYSRLQRPGFDLGLTSRFP